MLLTEQGLHITNADVYNVLIHLNDRLISKYCVLTYSTTVYTITFKM